MENKNKIVKTIGCIVKSASGGRNIIGIIIKIKPVFPFYDFIIFDLKNKQFIYKWAEGCVGITN